MYFALLSNIFSPHLRGGYELGCESIARALMRLGHKVVILTSKSIGQLRKVNPAGGLEVREIFEPVFEYEDAVHARLAASSYWQRRRQEAFGGVIVSNALALSRFLEESGPDVLWIFNPLGLGPVGILEAALSYPCKCIIHLMDHVDDAISQHQYSLFLEGRYRRLKASISAISCSRKILCANERVGSYRSHRVIYNGIHFDEIPSRPDRIARMDEPCRFVYFGQVTKAKGVSQIIRAAAQARTRNFTIDIIGRSGSSFQSELSREIAESHLENQVKILGFMSREDLLPRLTDYDAAIMLLSAAEPFGYAPIEAAAAGLPVTLTSGVGAAECFPADYPLFVADRENTTEIASKIDWCADNALSLRSIGLGVREHLRSYCDCDSVVMPAYLRTIRTAPVNASGFTAEGMIASYTSSKLYNQISW